MHSIAIDVGNTGTKYGVFDGETLVRQGSFTGDQLPVELLSETYDHAIIASVAGAAPLIKSKLAVSGSFMELTGQTALPVINDYKTPDTLGVDRIAGAVAANYLFKDKNCLVIDAGTCITYDYIDADRHYQGGSISPGIAMKFKALHTFTERLPLVQQSSQNFPLIGQTTKEAIESGVLNGTVAEMDGIIQAYTQKRSSLVVILCGGDAGFFESNLKGRIFVIPELVLIGLYRILIYNV